MIETTRKDIGDLNKALYGFKLSGRRWNETITEHLKKKNGFTQLISELCILKKVKNSKVSYIIRLNADDMIIYW